MRPINLIPEEERRGTTAKLRSGPLAYLLLGGLIAVLAGVSMLVVTGNEVSEKKAEVTELKSEVASAEARATELAAYTQFHEVHEQRVATVTNLAKSRFDWEKVMRQLALVLPDDVWLTDLTGSVRPDVGGGGSGLRQGVPGPALELNGCASSQEGVAGFISVLKDIDGVTRVGMQSSGLGGAGTESSGGGAAESVSATGSCKKKSMAQFQMVIAFDAAPIPEATSGEGVEVAPAPAPEGEGESEAASSTETG